MRLSSLASAAFALCTGVFCAESNLTEPRLTQKIITGDFKPPQVFENTNLVRTINLEKGYVRETTNILITNTDKAPQSEYYVPVENDVMGRIGGFDARDKKNPEIPLEVTIAALSAVLDDQGGSSRPTQYYIIHLTSPLAPRSTITLSVSWHTLGLLTPLPASIKQEEKQYLVYNFSAYVPTVYKTVKQKTKVKFPSADVPEYSTTTGLTSSSSDPEKQGSSFTYGPYDTAAITAGTAYPVTVRYEFNKPLLVATLLERDVEVSHWGGNLATEERYWLRHDGATLSNHFSRLAWGTQSFYIAAGQSSTSALRELKVPLKPGSVDPYFIDDIGNVSTSRFRPNNIREASLELKPRYPLFGGWKYSFRIGWNNALSTALRKLKAQSDTYVLSVPLVEGPKNPEGIQYEQVVFRVTLPEGAKNIRWQTHGGSGVPTLHAEQGLHKTFMDTLGRTELTLRAINVVDEARDVNVLVTYDYPWLAGFRKPVTIFIGLAGTFALAWAVGSVDTSIGRKKR